MNDPPKSDKCRKYDAAFRAKALRLAGESRSTQAAACALHINQKLLYKWQKVAQTPVAAALGAGLDPVTADELRHLRALSRRQAQELDMLKKSHHQRLLEAKALASPDPMSPLQFINEQRVNYAVQELCQVLNVVPIRYYAWRHTQAAGSNWGGKLQPCPKNDKSLTISVIG